MFCLVLALAGVRRGHGSGEAAGRQKHQKEGTSCGVLSPGVLRGPFLGVGRAVKKASPELSSGVFMVGRE